jgi:streptomycin 6-kinase
LDVSTLEAHEVPQHLAASYTTGFGEKGRAWIAGLPALATGMLERWKLERDGPVGAGQASLVLPVVRHDGTSAVLRLQMPRQETTAALIGLRAWNGKGGAAARSRPRE